MLLERGEHDDEERIAAGVARMPPLPEPKKSRFGRSTDNRQEQQRERVEQVRQIQRNGLSLEALKRVKEMYSEIHELQFKLSNL